MQQRVIWKGRMMGWEECSHITMIIRIKEMKYKLKMEKLLGTKEKEVQIRLIQTFKPIKQISIANTHLIKEV